MSVFSNFWDFIQKKMVGRQSVEISSEELASLIDKNKVHELELTEFVLNTGINIVANALSMCEVRTFNEWKEIRGDQYWRWNYEPNRNQTSNEFLHKLIWNLIYRNECLVIQNRKGEMVVADSYNHQCYGLLEDRFEDIVICQDGPAGVMHPLTLNRSYKMGDVLFYRLNNRNIANLLREIAAEYHELLDSAIKKFYKSGGERGILSVDGRARTANYGKKEDGTPRTYMDVYTELVNKNFSKYFSANNAVLPLFEGFAYDIKSAESTKKSTSEVKDVADLTDEIYGKVANALQIPAVLLKGEIADLAAATKNMVTFGIKPIADLIQTENNRKLYGEAVLGGSYQMIDTNRIIYTDIKDIADAHSKMIGSSIWSIDESRIRAGEPPLNTEWSQKHWMTKNNTEITMIGKEGGEGDAE